MEHGIATRPLNGSIRKLKAAQLRKSPVRWTQQDTLTAGILFILGLFSRLLFGGQVLYHWDSVNFAFSLSQFDIAAGQPHVPGYILYVYLGQVVNFFFRDPQLALLAISIVSSGLALVFLYKLGTEMFDRPTGLIAAVFLGASPLFWFYGEIALPHTLDALMVIILVWMLYRTAVGDAAWGIPAAVWLGIAGGFRPQTQVFLMPLALYAGWRLGWRRSLAALGILAMVDFAWFLPLIANTGGLGGYLHIMDRFSADFNTSTTVFSGGLWGLVRNARKLGMYTLYGWGLALLPAFAAVLISAWKSCWEGISTLRANLSGGPFGFLRHTRFWFFALWIAPTAVYYLLIHMGQQGLVFVFLPALMLLSAAGVETLRRSGLTWSRGAAAALAGAGALIFLLAPTFPLGSQSLKLLTADTLRRHDAYYLPRIHELSEHFSPENTVLLSSEWRFPQYYLPDYSLAPYAVGARWEVEDGRPDVKEETWINAASLGLTPDAGGDLYLVIIDNDLLPFNDNAARLEQVVFSNGETLAFIRFKPQEWIYLGQQSYGVAPVKTAH